MEFIQFDNAQPRPSFLDALADVGSAVLSKREDMRNKEAEKIAEQQKNALALIQAGLNAKTLEFADKGKGAIKAGGFDFNKVAKGMDAESMLQQLDLIDRLTGSMTPQDAFKYIDGMAVADPSLSVDLEDKNGKTKRVRLSDLGGEERITAIKHLASQLYLGDSDTMSKFRNYVMKNPSDAVSISQTTPQVVQSPTGPQVVPPSGRQPQQQQPQQQAPISSAQRGAEFRNMIGALPSMADKAIGGLGALAVTPANFEYGLITGRDKNLIDTNALRNQGLFGSLNSIPVGNTTVGGRMEDATNSMRGDIMDAFRAIIQSRQPQAQQYGSTLRGWM